jgi:RNase P/RNase MRP subunit p30
MASLFSLAGYSAVALTVPTGLMRDSVEALKRVFENEGIETCLRVDLAPNSRADLLRLLRRFRNQFDVVGVRCMNQIVAMVACRDRRVDLVFFDADNPRVRFNHPMANLLRGALEFNMLSTFLNKPRSAVFTRICKEIAVAKEHRNDVVLSSGCEAPAMVRSPLQISAIASTLGLSEEQCRLGVSSAPCSIIERNLERRSGEYVEEGVTLVTPKVR